MKVDAWVRLTLTRLLEFERFEWASGASGDEEQELRDLTEDEWLDKYAIFRDYVAEPPTIGDPEQNEEDPLVGDLEPEEPDLHPGPSPD